MFNTLRDTRRRRIRTRAKSPPTCSRQQVLLDI
jgi:hypothetical protein